MEARKTLRMSRTLGWKSIVASVLLVGLPACGLTKKAHVPIAGSPTKDAKFTIQVVVSDSANQNSPIPLDFVMVEDKKLVKDVAKLSAKDWFDRRVQVQRDFPTKVQVVSWEWVPGQQGGPIAVEIARGTRATFLFANYANGGDHRAAVDPKSPVIVTLGDEDFTVQRLK
jgi:type VI secretion system protein